jgi:lipoate-protein ligase A
MKLLDFTLSTPAENLACDEALLDVCEERGEETLRFWESPILFVVVGYGNRVASEVNVEECQRRGIPILRRCSGGGTVVQGPGCLNYNLTLRWEEDGPLASVTSTNQFIMERNRAALAQLLGLEVSVQGHTDLAFREVEHSRWIKFSGNAQRRRRYALVFHGTILHGFDLGLIDALLRFPSAQPDYRANRQHTEFVRNIPASVDQIRAAIRAAWSASDSPTEIPRERIEQLCREQYDNEEWNLRR